MRRLPIAAFALIFTLPLWAQHGGGGHGGGGGGHAGGFGGGHSFSGGGGHVAAGRFSGGGVHTFSGASRPFTRPSFSQRSFAPRSFSQRNFSQRASNRPFLHDGFRGSRFRGYGFRNNCYGYPCFGYGGYPYYGYGDYYDPFWGWWGDDSSYDDDYDQNVADAAEMNRESLEEQQMMRQEQADGDQDMYAHAAPMPRSATSDGPAGTAFMPGTLLVFRDQHKEEISNYAIVGQTLWNFSPQRTEKIPLADLDLAATAKANNDRGVTFRLPSVNEAQ